MSSSGLGGKKKQVRFAAAELQGEGDEEDDLEEDTLFDKRREAKEKGAEGFPARKGGRGRPEEHGQRQQEAEDEEEMDADVAIRRSSSPPAVSSWAVNIILCSSFLGLGMSVAVVGPTFQDLATNVKKNISNISYIFVGRSLGYVSGSVIGGILFDCMNHHLLLGFSMLITAVGLYAIPWCKRALLLSALMSLIGISTGFLDTGAEVTYGSFIFTHAKDYANMKESEAAGLNSLFWGTFAAVRGLAIFFAACVYPGTMVLLSVIGCTISSLFLALYSKNIISLWVGTGIYGASMATTFPSGISWAEQYTHITSRSAGIFVVGAALGEMVIPAVVGFLHGKVQDHPVLMYAILGSSAMTAILFPVMYKLASSQTHPKLRETGESEDQKALLSGPNEEEEEEDDAEEWNDADFEVIEMNDVRGDAERSSMGETSMKDTIDFSIKTSNQLSSNNASSNSSSPVVLGGSPRKKFINMDREKND
nr:PREDICTED: sodium-dependent glucose transporter 1 isoform X2 [Latimeria chalumnae]|eukprot:XP_014340996.1 PREDICTED: sodium-dependent glucose transporter 1 isoform X2 [Latimeria chalumnae]